MNALWIGFIFSFIGSIPPGSLNISVIQLALNKQLKAAFRFALAAAIIEFPYAYIAVVFEAYISANPFIVKNFQLIAAIVMCILAVVNLWPSKGKIVIVSEHSGFRKGVLLSVLNPLAIPFWIGVTAYLKANNWLELHSGNQWIYVLGISLGTFSLLSVLALLGARTAALIQHQKWIKLIPGFVFLLLGVYAFYQYLSF